MTRARPPAVAGLFYPADPEELSRQVRGFLRGARGEMGTTPKAIVAPHAGYVYSGPVAGSAYAQIADRVEAISRVVLLGPSHRIAFQGLAATEADSLLTPLGAVAVDQAAYARVADLPQVRRFEAPYEGEHCLEVQLPFLQLVLGDFRVVPFLVGEADTETVAEVLERLWGGEETLIVVSSDLSHYLDYESARAIDARTSLAIESLHPEDIGYHQACGRNPLNGLLREARRHGLHGRTLDLRNSGDTAGPRGQVVGYGAYAFA
ncbi:MAG: AmmeMemoRadiSam system protein B [Chromatiaceae bacterium]|nr:AmmeMemoRadiSam system protein B [Chromatiaceae bacterium]